jgi:hypothetical protein
MKYEKFEKIINFLESQNTSTGKAYDVGIQLYDFLEPSNRIIEFLISECYDEYAWEWISWFCYENNFGKGSLTAHDENDEPICYSMQSLWEYLEKEKLKNI